MSEEQIEIQGAEMPSKLPAVAIVGRPNVGKSSLFNAVVGRRLAIVHEQAGVTRDRVMTTVRRDNRRFRLIDTGGLGRMNGEKHNGEQWDDAITAQVDAAVADADVLILLGDAQAGITPLDEDIAARLRATGKKVLCAANKCDNPRLSQEAVEFTRLGFDKIFPVCCEHRFGIDALFDEVFKFLPHCAEEDAEHPRRPSIAVVGRPNVGKSSLVNAILGEDRMIIADIAGTTRDAVDAEFTLKSGGQEFPAVLVDTAGLRKNAKVDDAVEFFSIMRSKSAIERADVVVLVVEASPDGATAQDRKVAALIQEAGKAAVIAVNKCDLRSESASELVKAVKSSLPGLDFAPATAVSASKKRNLSTLCANIALAMNNADTELPTGVLNRVLGDAVATRTPPVVSTVPMKLFYAAMTGTRPLRVKLFVNRVDAVAPNYLTFLQRRLRSAFELTGVPLRLEPVARPKKVPSFQTRSNNKNRKK